MRNLKFYFEKSLKRLDKLRPIVINKTVPPVIIYQMGKVGSSSVYASLKSTDIPNSIFHVHQLSHTGFNRKEAWLKFSNIKKVPDDFKYSKKFRHIIDANREKMDWKIITLTREPIGLIISGIFENMRMFFKQLLDIDKKPVKEDILDFLSEHFRKLDISKNYYLNWFDEELKDVFDIDVYSEPYDFENGFSILSRGNVSTLVMRLEDMARVFDKAIYRFMNLEKVCLQRMNVGSKKYYSTQYKEVLKLLKLPLRVCEQIYSTKYAQHFYTPDEISCLIKKWTTSKP